MEENESIKMSLKLGQLVRSLFKSEDLHKNTTLRKVIWRRRKI